MFRYLGLEVYDGLFAVDIEIKRKVFELLFKIFDRGDTPAPSNYL